MFHIFYFEELAKLNCTKHTCGNSKPVGISSLNLARD